MIQNGGELVAELLSDDLPRLAELLVEPLGRGVQVRVDVLRHRSVVNGRAPDLEPVEWID